MNTINSAKAYNHIYERFCCKRDEVCGLEYWDGFTEISHSELLQMINDCRDVAIMATKIAEKEAEERHTKEIEDLRQKAIQAHQYLCPVGLERCSAQDHKEETRCNGRCYYLSNFIQRLR